MSYSNLLAEDKKLVTYRPRLNEITGSVTATVLLQQIIFHADNVGNRPFYKFRAPCEHKLYRGGDSWIEELGFSPAEFDTARSKIATRLKKGDSKTEALRGETANHLVIYWTDANRVTWYLLNVDLLNRILEKLYADSRNSNYQKNEEGPNSENQDSEITRNLEKQDLPLSETTSETTPEKTTEKDSDFPKKPKERTIKVHLRREKGQPKPISVEEGVVEAIIEQTRTHQDQFDLSLNTVIEREKAGGDIATPPAAGGAATLADALITIYCRRMGEAMPEGGELIAARATFERVLKRKKLSQDGLMAQRGLFVLLDPEGEWAFHFGNYAISGGENRTRLFETHYGKVLARLKAGGDGYSKQHHEQKGPRRHGPHQRHIAPGAAQRRVATEEEARRILG